MGKLATVGQRLKWLTAFFAAGDPGRPLDPVRIQKGMFLLSQEGTAPLKGLYQFEPYHFGPMSFQLYHDLDALTSSGALQSQVPPGQTWKTYGLTDRGQQRGREALAQADPATRKAIVETMDFVKTRSFRRLLKDVYSKYPAYAAKSVLR